MAYCVFGIVIAAICRFGYNIVMEANHMKRGKFYTYTFTISLKEIKVSAAKVNDWGSVTGNFDVN